eukprot:5297327-Pyramimonas_sp.AAC.2
MDLQSDEGRGYIPAGRDRRWRRVHKRARRRGMPAAARPRRCHPPRQTPACRSAISSWHSVGGGIGVLLTTAYVDIPLMWKECSNALRHQPRLFRRWSTFSAIIPDCESGERCA